MTDDRTEQSRRVITEFGERYAAGDPTVWDDLGAADFVNHAAGPQGRDGWRVTFENLRHDLGTTPRRSTTPWPTATTWPCT